mgnify:CR=1 FL=1
MNTDEILAALERLGKPGTAAIYRRHGAGESAFGVLTSEIARLRKTHRVGHDSAAELWRTGNAEARILALLAVDPGRLTRADAETWVGDGPLRFLGCYLAPLLARSPIAEETMRDWMASSDASRREMGYAILAERVRADPDALDDGGAERVLRTIEDEIHGAANWVRYAMNGALIAIGVAKPALRGTALAAARRIGTVEVDHGETYCKTPDAVLKLRQAERRRR